MQATHKIAGTSATGYAAYLTSESDRGDYYVAAGEEDEAGEGGGVAGGAQGRWHGSQELLMKLGISPNEPVQKDELSALMKGVSPANGQELRPVGSNGRRVAGIDLTFSAPKSVSASWAVSGPAEREQIERAHTQAVASAIERVERQVELVRGRVGGEVRHERAKSVLAAQFVHTSSRLTRDQEKGGCPTRNCTRTWLCWAPNARTGGSRRWTPAHCSGRRARTARGTGRSSRTSWDTSTRATDD